MDTIPNETHAAEATATLDAIEHGLAAYPLSKAVNTIDGWRRTVLDTEREDLRPVADGLADLHRALTGTRIDGHSAGRILVQLGEHTEAAADTVPNSTPEDSNEGLRRTLKRLGSLLRHAGSAMA